MAFPTLQPTSRVYDPGDWPVKKYSALSGAEIRIRYGTLRTNAKLSLSYENIPDSLAEQFLTHYYSVTGTFSTFTVPASVSAGWQGSSASLNSGSAGTAFRYDRAPQITSVRPGVSTVQVELLGVS